MKGEVVALCAILVLAGWLRLHDLNQAEFQWDQAEISKWALELGQEGVFRWIGPVSSTGIDTFPAAIWLYAIPYSVSTNPIVATGFVALINLTAVLGCYLLSRRWFGTHAALMATLLYAVAPWAVLYSRKIWHTVLLPPLVLMYVWTGWLAFVRRSRAGLVVHGLSLALLVQTHFSTYPFVILTLLWALLFRKRLDWRFVPVAAIAAGLPFVPYLVYDAHRGWMNIGRLAQAGRLASAMGGEAVRNAWVAATGQGLDLVTGPDRYSEFRALTPNVRWLFGAVGVMAVVGASFAIVGAIRRGRRRMGDRSAAALLAASWLLVPVLLLSQGFTWPAPHYFTILFPAPFVLAGYLTAELRESKGLAGRITRAALPALVAMVAIAQMYEVVTLTGFVWAHDTVLGFGTPLGYELAAAETAERLVGEAGGGEVILLSEGDEPRSFEMPNVADILLYQTPHRAVDIRSVLAFPAGPAVFWSTYEPTPGEDLLGRMTPELFEERIVLREGRRSYRFYRWPGGEFDIPLARTLPGGPAEWANGASLKAYTVAGDLAPGSKVRWTLIWQPQRTPEKDVYYHWYNHLLDADGVLIAQKDGPSLLPAYWRPGDTVLNWFELDIPSGSEVEATFMRVGMYEYPSLERVGLEGSAEGQNWVVIGPLPPGSPDFSGASE